MTIAEISKKLLKISAGALPSERRKAFVILKQLDRVIAHHDVRYYRYNEPEISDSEYDQLKHFKQRLKEIWPAIKSKREVIPTDITGRFTKTDHLVPMLSLENTQMPEDVGDFIAKTKRRCNKKQLRFTVEPKFDGTGISLIYENNHFIRGATRGDGLTGEDITANILRLASLPLHVDFRKLNTSRIELRGEIILPKKIFKDLNLKRKKSGLPLFANARNAAAGSVRLKDPEEAALRGLEIYIYQVAYARDINGLDLLASVFRNHDENIRLLHNLDFKTPYAWMQCYESENAAIDALARIEKERKILPYEIDGAVVKVNDGLLYDQLGFTSHHPHWAIAYKFKAQQGSSKLLNVNFQVGRSGIVTPVARLEPVKIGGVLITSASLHNEDFIRTKDIRIGDTVLVDRAGDVIPYIVKSVTNVRTGREKRILFPKTCPECGSKLIKDNERNWHCKNISCPARIRNALIHFTSRNAMNIQGLGASRISLLCKEGLLKNYADIYRLDDKNLCTLEGFGQKLTDKLLQNIKDSRRRPLAHLIYALGIPHVGFDTAKVLSGSVKCLEDLFEIKASAQKFRGLGNTSRHAVRTFFSKTENRRLILELKKLGVNTCR